MLEREQRESDTTAAPDPATTAEPDPATTVEPDPATTAEPDPATTAEPDPATTADSNVNATQAPDPATTPEISTASQEQCADLDCDNGGTALSNSSGVCKCRCTAEYQGSVCDSELNVFLIRY